MRDNKITLTVRVDVNRYNRAIEILTSKFDKTFEAWLDKKISNLIARFGDDDE